MSGIAARSGSWGSWPMSPAAKPANPAPSSSRPSRWVAGTSFAFGFPCMSTNCANRNSTSLSRMYRSTSSRELGAVNGLSLIGPANYPLAVPADNVRTAHIAAPNCAPDNVGLHMGRP